MQPQEPSNVPTTYVRSKRASSIAKNALNKVVSTNTIKQDPANPVEIPVPVQQPAPLQQAAPVQQEPVVPQVVETEPAVEEDNTFTPAVETPPAVEPPLDADKPDDTPLLKKLRGTLKTLSKQNDTYKTELETTKKRLTDFETGLAMPETITQMQAKIEELSRYEEMVNLKKSPAYKRKYIEPLTAETEKLSTMAKEYGVAPEVLEAARNATSVADTNRILSQAFRDNIGALEAKGIIANIKKIEKEAAEAEKTPSQALAAIQSEHEQWAQAEREREVGVISNTARDTWTESIVELRKDPRFPELQFREGDTEHNEKVVLPIITRAGQEYGKIVKTLVDNGLRSMPREVGIAMSKMVQLAHQAGILAVERDKLSNRVKELEGLLKDRHSVNRPGMTNRPSTPADNSKPTGGKAIARAALNRVMGTAK